MTREAKARQVVGSMVVMAGWAVQKMDAFDLSHFRGVAVPEFPLAAGFADFVLFVDGQAMGVVEAFGRR